MRTILILLPFLAFIMCKPIGSDDEAIASTVDSVTASNGLHFGDKTDWYNPTTPRDASNRFSLTFLQDDFPDKPEHSEPIYNRNDQPPVEKKPVKRSVPGPQPVDNNKEFFNNVFNSVRPVRGTQPGDAPQIPLNKFVNAVEGSLLNAAQNVAARKTRSSDISPEDFEMTKTVVNSHDLPILSPIVFAKMSNKTSDTTEATAVPSSSSHQPDIAIIQTINSTQYISHGETVKVQQDKLQLFTVSPAVLSNINPAANLALLTTAKSPDASVSSSTSVPPSTTASLLKKTKKESQNLQEKLAEVEADPVILTQGI